MKNILGNRPPIFVQPGSPLETIFNRQAALMRDYAAKAKAAPRGKFRGYTEEKALKVAEHNQAIADGKRAVGTVV